MEGKGKKHFYLIVIFILFLLPQSVIHAQDVVENLDNDITNLDIGLSITAEDFYYRFADSAATG